VELFGSLVSFLRLFPKGLGFLVCSFSFIVSLLPGMLGVSSVLSVSMTTPFGLLVFLALGFAAVSHAEGCNGAGVIASDALEDSLSAATVVEAGSELASAKSVMAAVGARLGKEVFHASLAGNASFDSANASDFGISAALVVADASLQLMLGISGNFNDLMDGSLRNVTPVKSG